MRSGLRQRFGWRTSLDAGIAVPGSRGGDGPGRGLVRLRGRDARRPGGRPARSSPARTRSALPRPRLACGVMAATALVVAGRLPAWSFAAGARGGHGRGRGRHPLLGRRLALRRCRSASRSSTRRARFLPRPVTLAVISLTGALLAAELVDQDRGDAALGAWVATAGTLAGAGLLVAVLRERVSHAIAGLTEAARRDPLTGLLNRRGFEEVFDIEIERARRTEQNLSMIVGDLDRFKRVNDERGHAAGNDPPCAGSAGRWTPASAAGTPPPGSAARSSPS